MEKNEYKVLFDNEKDHWWYVGLRNLIIRYVKKATHESSCKRILDAGCGTGLVLLGFQSEGHHAFGIDISEEAFPFLKLRNVENSTRASICQIPFKDETFDVVYSLDVLYHLGVSNDELALREIHRVLRKGGIALVHLPAFDRLRGAHDYAIHTRHRYTKKEFSQKAKFAGYSIEMITYRNMLLFPLAAAYRIVTKLFSGKGHAKSDVGHVSMPINHILSWILNLENAFIDIGFRPPWGLSLFCILKKP